MPSSDNHRSPIPFASFRRSILTIRSDQIRSATTHDSSIQNLDSFQRQIFTRFNNLSAVNSDELLSISWIHNLLDAFTACLDDFTAILSDNKSLLSKPPSDRLASDYFDRAIKAMDIFNSARDGVQAIRLWQKHLEIIACALDSSRTIVEGQFRRARKALMDLALKMLDEKDAGPVFSSQNRSFGRKGKEQQHRAPAGHTGHARSLSWSVSHNWSASKQLQSIAYNLFPPRASDVASTNGLATLVFSMSFVLMFVLWVLVAAIPCQDRGVQVHYSIPRQFSWSMPFSLIQSRILEESKKRDRRSSCGLLKEIYGIEKFVHRMTDLIDASHFPLSEEMKNEVRESVDELSLVCEVCKNGLDPLERKLRETFRKVINCRTEGIEYLGKGTEA